MSPTPAIQTLGLRKTYRTARGRRVGVEGLDLRVAVGGVHALLGPAGAGATTTVRMLLGLVRPDAGAVRIFGVPVPERLPDVSGCLGAVVAGQCFFPGFSGRRSLTLLAAAAGVPRGRVDEVLALVGLADGAADVAVAHAPGTTPRLALAAALLRDPDLLILDEPAQGLDPQGVRDVRALVRRFADQGRTVLLSSHSLTEVQQVADTVSIIADGRLLAQGAVNDLVGDGRATARVRVAEPADAGRAAEVLRGAGLVRVRTEGEVVVADDVGDPADVTRALARQKIWVSELVPQREDLDAVLRRLGGAGEAPADAGRRAGVKAAGAKAGVVKAAVAKTAGSAPGGASSGTPGPGKEPAGNPGPGKPGPVGKPAPGKPRTAGDPPGRVKPGGSLPPGITATPAQNGQSKHRPAGGPGRTRGGAA